MNGRSGPNCSSHRRSSDRKSRTCCNQKIRRGELSLGTAIEALDAVCDAVSIHEPSGLYLDALSIAQAIGVGATYDPLYLALAEAERCDLWTADRRFVQAVGYRSARVRWLGELSTKE